MRAILERPENGPAVMLKFGPRVESVKKLGSLWFKRLTMERHGHLKVEYVNRSVGS